MEKLIVKNFGPIKEAEIELTKYVVFIGDTSTGKSVLAKLISIFRDANFIFQNQGVKNLKSFSFTIILILILRILHLIIILETIGLSF